MPSVAVRNHSQFVQDYQRRFLHKPSPDAILAYAVAAHLVQAIVEAENPAMDAVTTVLQRMGSAGSVVAVQLQASSDAKVVYPAEVQQVPVLFPMPSWADRPCWTTASNGYGFGGAGCVPCPNGTVAQYNQAAQRRECMPCAGSSLCQSACGHSGEACISCPPGMSNATGTCVECPPGHFAFTSGLSSCSVCPPGFVSVPSRRECEACPVGQYAPEAGLNACLHCQVGHEANGTGRSFCTSCPAGRFSLFGICQDCPLGSFQAASGQSKCHEDGLGQRSATTGTSIPVNVPGYYAIWAAADLKSFEMERCLREEDCLTERCAEGHTGRQCIALLGGFSGAPSSYQCLSWQLYVAIGIVLTLLYLVVYTSFAVFLATSASSASQPYLIMMKMLLNHCASMSVLMSCFFRSFAQSGLMELIISYLMITDGAPPCENELFSLPCLLQPWRTKALQDAFAHLASVPQVAYYSTALAQARAALASYQYNTALRLLLFWALLPLAAAMLPCLLLLIWLRLYMARHAQHWQPITDFATKIYFFGWDATSLYEPEVLERFMAISQTRLWGLSWPLMHSENWTKAEPKIRGLLASIGCCLVSPLLFLPRLLNHLDLLRFWSETEPLRMVMLYCLSFPAARRASQSLYCQELGQTGPDQVVLYYSGAIECSPSQSLHYLAALGALIWSLWPFLCWWQMCRSRKNGMEEAAFRRRYGIMLLGYNNSCWWWEVVVFLRKFFLIIAEVLPLSPLQRYFFISCVALAALIGQVTAKPSDQRFEDLLTGLEMKQLLVLLISSSLCMMTAQGWLQPFGVVIAVAVLHVLYVATVAFSMGLIGLTAADAQTFKRWEQGTRGCLKRFTKLLVTIKDRQSAGQPYVAYDNAHRFVSVLGSAAGRCPVPHLPIGRQLGEAGRASQWTSHMRQVRCKLSEVPRHLKDFTWVSLQQRRAVAREILFTVAYIAKSSAVMSSLLLDFVVRATFLIAAEQSRDAQDDDPQEVDKHAWQEANRRRDLLVIAKLAEEARLRAAVLGQVVPGGPALQEELRSEKDAVISWGHWDLCHAVQQRLLKEDRSLEPEDFVHLEESQTMAFEGEHVPTTPTAKQLQLPSAAESARALPHHEGQERVQQKVYKMFSPTIFRRGCTFQELKEALVVLRSTPWEELQLWLEFFERVWFREFLDNDKEIHLMAGTHLETGVGATASEILQSTSRRLHVKQLELDEVNIKVCLKWVRFVLYYYCGGIQAMSLGDVMRVRLSRPSQYLIKAEMAALEITDSEEGHEEQDLELHQSLEVIHRTVDEDALMRVEQGLDLALARGLSLEPTDLALERLERGIDFVLASDDPDCIGL
ncbi:unnamed protein product [Durusdinium trenchii]|uniref:Tyrosine-protein kinase ephrin type A/B receptor-like domain-containing protein n=1 Tax=Durusdinium trenchii TaxID=1381693 RepID=A0ABP0MIL0_9DINO